MAHMILKSDLKMPSARWVPRLLSEDDYRDNQAGYVRGRCPYHHDVLILDTMLALKHARYFQRTEDTFNLFIV